jgi:hypothetical protein
MSDVHGRVMSSLWVACAVASAAAGVTALGIRPLAAQGRGGTPAVESVPRSPQGTPDLSGYWELRFDSANVPKARLRARLTPARVAAQSRKDAHAMRWCNWLGTPFAMTDYRPLDIRQGRREVAIVFEMQNAVARHVYLNRTEHIDQETFDRSTNGDSIARWDGDVLVAETIGFADDRGVTAIPGGGFRTSSSTLVERFRLLPGGQMLSVVSTWTDPNVFAAPHTYEYRYYRAPREYEGRRIACAPGDTEERNRYMTEPPQILPRPAAKGVR